MSGRKLGLDNNTRNRVYSGNYTGEETANSPLDQMMKPDGDQKKVTYDEGLLWVEGTPKWGLNVETADRVRFDATKLRYRTHGKNPGDDDQAKGSV
jgi:hypothetical protein